ncbi:hypothetical protein HJFPF1_05976 [Paramyrothecium foliicola]|nr:hypothetical protein HJFPF1_05976 [Paramyrothecium foliicola]
MRSELFQALWFWLHFGAVCLGLRISGSTKKAFQRAFSKIAARGTEYDSHPSNKSKHIEEIVDNHV